MESERHVAVGGRVNLYRRTSSRFWQCQSSIAGKSERTSTKTENLNEARIFAEKWYLSKSEGKAEISQLSKPSSGVTGRSRELFSLSLHDKRSRYLAAAIELVSEVGFRDAQVTTISERAGFAPGTLYRHFQSRTELLVEVVAHVSQHEVNVVAGIAMGADSPAEILRKCAFTFSSRARIVNTQYEPTDRDAMSSVRRPARPTLNYIYSAGPLNLLAGSSS